MSRASTADLEAGAGSCSSDLTDDDEFADEKDVEPEAESSGSFLSSVAFVLVYWWARPLGRLVRPAPLPTAANARGSDQDAPPFRQRCNHANAP